MLRAMRGGSGSGRSGGFERNLTQASPLTGAPESSCAYPDGAAPSLLAARVEWPSISGKIGTVSLFVRPGPPRSKPPQPDPHHPTPRLRPPQTPHHLTVWQRLSEVYSGTRYEPMVRRRYGLECHWNSVRCARPRQASRRLAIPRRLASFSRSCVHSFPYSAKLGLHSLRALFP